MVQKKSQINKPLERNKNARQEQKLQETLHRKYRKRSYSETWRPAYLGALGTSFIFNLFSFITGSFAMGYFLHQAFGFLNPTLALGIAILLAMGLAVMIEFMKRNTSSNFFQALIFCHSFKLSYLVGMVLMIGLSIGLSFYGSTKLPRTLSTPPLAEHIDLEDIEAINANYTTQIAAIESQIASIEANAPRWKGKFNRETSKTINNLHLQVADLQQQQNEAVNQAKITNTNLKAEQKSNHDEALQTYEAEEESRGYLLGYVSLITECLFMLCFMFMETYLDRCALERGMLYNSWDDEEDEEVPTSNTPPHENHHHKKRDEENEGHNVKDYTGGSRTIIENETNNDRIVVKGYVHVPTQPKEEQKEDKNISPLSELQQQIRDVWKDTYTHTKKDGSTVEMKESDIYNRIKKYRLGILDLEEKIKSGNWTNFTKERYIKKQQWLEYWEKALKEVQEQNRKNIASA